MLAHDPPLPDNFNELLFHLGPLNLGTIHLAPTPLAHCQPSQIVQGLTSDLSVVADKLKKKYPMHYFIFVHIVEVHHGEM